MPETQWLAELVGVAGSELDGGSVDVLVGGEGGEGCYAEVLVGGTAESGKVVVAG